MRLSEVLEMPDLKNAGIVVIGVFKTRNGDFKVLARKGEKLLPFPKFFHLIEDDPADSDPDLDPSEIRVIYRRFLRIPPRIA